MVLIDTSVWIYALKKNFHPAVKKRVETLLSETDVAINWIIALELLAGAKTGQDYERLRKRLDALVFLDTDREFWEMASFLAFQLKKKGITPPYADVVIAASAMRGKAFLLHADSHFETIAQHSELRTEDLSKTLHL